LHSIAPELVGRQFIYFLVGFVFFFLMQTINLKRLTEQARPLYVLLMLVLLGMLLFGITTRSTTRWINLPLGFKMQPSQLVTLVVGLLLANQWPAWQLNRWRDLASFALAIGLPVMLVFLQPDLGTSLVILISLSSTLLLSSINKKKVIIIGFIGVFAVLFTWFFLLKPYQRVRITGFGGESASNQASSYNARQALIAVGSGGMYGRGLGAGVQSHLRFLPERQTDFVFASIAEEWGFVGSVLIVLLYFGLVVYLLFECMSVEKAENKVFLLVLASNLFLQVLINIGMNIGLAPVTGLTLPLVSYGGSSVISFLLYMGLAYRLVSKRNARSTLEIK